MYKRLLVAVDGSETANTALLDAIQLARENEAELRLVNVIDETTVPWEEQGQFRRQRAVDAIARASDRILADAQRAIRLAGRQADGTQRVRSQRPETVADLIVAEARDWSADLIVMGSSGHGPIRRALLGSVDAAVMRCAPMPVLAVRAAPPGPQQTGSADGRATPPRRMGLA
jgi:nucleotide-binding universal stress UspA family protein